MRLRNFSAALALVLATNTLSACGSDTTEANSLAGSYHATTFQVTPPASTAKDVLAAGGSLTMNINADNTTSGTLTLPASVTGSGLFTASMAGTATMTRNTVTFQQTADTFVRDLSWTFSGNTLIVTNQNVAGAVYTITLTK